MEEQNQGMEQKTVVELMGAFRRFHRRQMEIESKGAKDRKRSEGKILLLLSDAPKDKGLKVSELSQKMRVTSPFVTQLLNGLEEGKLIQREHDLKDRRIVRVLLTEEGERAAEGIHKWFFARYFELTKHLGQEDSKQLAKLLHKTFDFLDTKDKLIDNEGEEK